MKTVDARQQKVLFGRYFGHFGGHLEYANEPNFNQFFSYTSKDTYQNLRLLQSKLSTTEC